MNAITKRETRFCTICEKELNDELIMRVKNKDICYECSTKIAYALDAEETEYVSSFEAYDYNKEISKGINKKINKSKKKEKKEYDILKTVNKVCSSVKGQDDLVKRVVHTIIKNQKYPNRKGNILIVGNSGMGKTQTLKSTFEYLDVPYVIEDITSYTEAGYVGKDTDELVKNLYYKYNCDAKFIEKGVIVIDEFDKLAKCNDTDKDVSGKGVQKSLLKLLEGKITDIQLDIWGSNVRIDTSKITFVLLGVFPELKEIRNKRLKGRNKNSIGFLDVKETDVAEYENTNYIAEDFEKAGFMTEVIGRIKVILEASDLTEENFYDILTKSKLSSLSDIRKEFSQRNIRLVIKNGTLQEMAKKAYTYKTGARAINTVIEDTFSKVLYELDTNLKKKYKTCIITSNTVKDNENYILKQ